MNLHIHPAVIGFGCLPPNFKENSSGHLTYVEEGEGFVFGRDDIHAVDRTNMDLLTGTERAVLREIAHFFACNPSVHHVCLRPS